MRRFFAVLMGLFALAALMPWGCANNNNSPSAPVTMVVTATPVPDAGSLWQLVLSDTASPASSQFPERYGLSTLVYNGALWVIAGGGNANNLNDAWSSMDGAHWTNALGDTASPGSGQFSRRVDQAAVAYNGALWVIGGYTGSAPLNDVWTSTDGTHWTKVLADTASPPTTQFSERYSHACLVFNGALWVIGGYGGSGALNDAWTSTDGVHWTNVLANNASPAFNQFPPKYAEGAVVYGGALWLIGGAQTGTNLCNDVWNSTDGIHWTKVLANNPAPPLTQFSQRLGLSAVVYNGALWITGGNNPSQQNDVWTSPNGATWTQLAVTAAFPPRAIFGMVTENNKMWVIGGMGGSNYLNDVWVSP